MSDSLANAVQKRVYLSPPKKTLMKAKKGRGCDAVAEGAASYQEEKPQVGFPFTGEKTAQPNARIAP